MTKWKKFMLRAAEKFVGWISPGAFIWGPNASPVALISPHVKKGESIGVVAAQVLLSVVREADPDSDMVTVTMMGLTSNGQEIGDWELVVRRITNPENSADK